MKYASLLAQKLEQHGTQVWLVNTGELWGECAGQVWCGGRRLRSVAKVFTPLPTAVVALLPPALAGWTGGPYGVGCRMNLRHTFAIVDAIHSGELRNAEYETLPTFDLQVGWMWWVGAPGSLSFAGMQLLCCAVPCLLAWACVGSTRPRAACPLLLIWLC